MWNCSNRYSSRYQILLRCFIYNFYLIRLIGNKKVCTTSVYITCVCYCSRKFHTLFRIYHSMTSNSKLNSLKSINKMHVMEKDKYLDPKFSRAFKELSSTLGVSLKSKHYVVPDPNYDNSDMKSVFHHMQGKPLLSHSPEFIY